MIHIRTALAAGAIGAGLVVAVAGCTQAPVTDSPVVTSRSSDTSAAASDGSSSTAGTSVSAPVSATSSAKSSATGTSRTSASASASPIGSSSRPASDPNACKDSAIAITVERGSGTTGHQYALLRFTNKSSKSCNLSGFPSAQLMASGRLVGSPAGHSNKPVATVSIAPGKSAAAELQNDSTCNADNSDSVRVVAPGQTTPTTQPLRMRICVLTVDPVTAG